MPREVSPVFVVAHLFTLLVFTGSVVGSSTTMEPRFPCFPCSVSFPPIRRVVLAVAARLLVRALGLASRSLEGGVWEWSVGDPLESAGWKWSGEAGGREGGRGGRRRDRETEREVRARGVGQ